MGAGSPSLYVAAVAYLNAFYPVFPTGIKYQPTPADNYWENQIAALLPRRDYLPQSQEKSRFFCAPSLLASRIRKNSEATGNPRCSHNQHRIPIAVEPILFANRLSIRLGNQLPAAKRL